MEHPRVRFEFEDFAYLVGIVISEVDTGSNTKLKHMALRLGDDTPANFIQRLRISERANDMRID
jgi:hypothetical protein